MFQAVDFEIQFEKFDEASRLVYAHFSIKSDGSYTIYLRDKPITVEDEK